jgi:hypothetical protein
MRTAWPLVFAAQYARPGDAISLTNEATQQKLQTRTSWPSKERKVRNTGAS